ncbi:MAG: hypothetical protein ACI8W8_003751 [Rhodothermales bacterium]|jgi:hypothetical protein
MNIWFSALFAIFAVGAFAAEIPYNFIERRCLNCHDSDTQKGDLDLEAASTDWSQRQTEGLWMRVLEAIEQGLMPPPDTEERTEAAEALHGILAAHSQIGGSVIRRLNTREYENSVRIAVGLPFSVPAGFPEDLELHGFDNNASGLILSPTLLERYFEAATTIAETLLPPARNAETVVPRRVDLAPSDFSMNFEASQLRDGALRLVSRGDILVRSCSWPTRFEAKHSGSYQIETTLRAFKPEGAAPLVVELLVVQPSMTFTNIDSLRRAARFELPADGKAHSLEAELQLEAGETVAFYWANSSFGWARADTREAAAKQFNARFRANPKLFPAWQAIGGYDRQRTPKGTWGQLKAAITGDLPAAPQKLPPRYPATVQNQLMWTFENMHMELGPALDILGASIIGPYRVTGSKKDKEQQLRTQRLLGERRGQSDADWTRAILAACRT